MTTKVLVTGATGQIGYMIFDRLNTQPEKYDAYALGRRRQASDRVPSKWTLNIPDEKFILCDLSNYDDVLQAVKGMDIVVHLAADPEGDEWESVLKNNVIVTYNVFEACKQEGVKRIVAGSSIMVSEGHLEEEPYKAMRERRREDVPTDVPMITPNITAEPRGLYAASKVWTESLGRFYSARHGISCICVRIGQVVRDRPRPPYGHDIFVSQRDITQILERCVEADEKLRFEVFYGISNNDYRWVDIDYAREKIGYLPEDRAEDEHDYDAPQ